MNLLEQAASLVFSILIITVLNYYLDRLDFYVNREDVFFFFPKFTDAFRFYIPFITVQFGLSAILAVYLIVKRKMTLFPKIAGYCIKGYSIAVLIGLLTIDRVVGAPTGLLHEENPPVDVHSLSIILNNVMKGLFVLIIVLTVIEIIRDIVKKAKLTTEDILPE